MTNYILINKFLKFLFVENNYEPIVEGLQQDLENDLSNLKASYDEEREREVEKIRLKYINI